MSRRLLLALGAVAVVVVVVVGLSQTHSGGSKPKPGGFNLAAARADLRGAPAPIAAVTAQAGRLLPGSKSALDARLKELKGHPVVINKWASWCPPCRGEFPTFQQVGVKFGRQVAFLGLDSGDNDADATKFLKQFPLPYPSYVDRNSRIAQDLEIAQSYPTTMFYDAGGKVAYVHQGPYTTEAALAADIRRYALGQS